MMLRSDGQNVLVRRVPRSGITQLEQRGRREGSVCCVLVCCLVELIIIGG